MRNYFVIDFKKYGGAEAFRKVVSGHNARKRNAKRPNVDPARTSNNIDLSPLRWKSRADMMETKCESEREWRIGTKKSIYNT